MSAAIEVYMGREQAWHGLGTVLGRAFTYEDIEKEAPELLMEVSIEPTYVKREVFTDNHWFKYEIETPLKAAIVRADGKIVGEGVGKESYGIVQPTQALELGDAISGKSGYPIISAGTIREGRQFFFTYDAGQITPGGLPIDRHLTIASSHDGTLALLAIHSTTVVVCANTLAMALASASDRTTFKHTAHVADLVENAIHAIQTEQVHAQLVNSEIERLMLVKVSDNDQTNLLTQVVPPKFNKKGEEAPRGKRARSAIRGLLHSPVTEGFEGTGWGFVQAVNTYENWNQPIRGDRSLRQFDAMLKGRQPLTDRAVKRTLELV